MQISVGTSKAGLAAGPLTKTDRFPAVALFSGLKWNNDVSPAWVILGQSFSVSLCFHPPPHPHPRPPPAAGHGAARAVGSGSSAFVLGELGEWGEIIFITLCTNASRVNGKRQSNLLLQGISWLPAGSGRNFALPSLLGLNLARHQRSMCLAPKKLSCSCNSSLFLLRKMTEGMINAYGVPKEVFHYHLQQVGLGELLMTLPLGAKHRVAFPLGVFDCLPLMCSPSMAQWEFSAFKSFLFNSKSLWVLALLRLNIHVCLPAGSFGVGDIPITIITTTNHPGIPA